MIVIKGLESSAVEVRTDLELLWTEFKISYLKFILGVCYRTPSYGRDYVEKLRASLEEVFSTYPERIIILAGDFNFPSINWSDGTVASTSIVAL